MVYEDLKPYINITLTNSVHSSDGHKELIQKEVKTCEKSEVAGGNIELEKKFDEIDGWNDNSLLCLDQIKSAVLQNSESMEDHKFLEIKISKCTDKPYCETDKNKLKEFIDKLKINTFMFEAEVDFLNREEFPIYESLRQLPKMFLKYD